MESLLLNAISSFKGNRTNWITSESTDNDNKCLPEPSLTKKLKTYIDRETYQCSAETTISMGRCDLEVFGLFVNGPEKAFIECKLIKNDDIHKIRDKYDSAITQIKHYTENSKHSGYLIFFIFGRDVNEIKEILLENQTLLLTIDNPKYSTGFTLIYDEKYKIMFVSLPSESPTETHKNRKMNKTKLSTIISNSYTSAIL